MTSMFSLQITLNDLRDIRIVLVEDFIDTVTVCTSISMVIEDLLNRESSRGLSEDRDNIDFTYNIKLHRHNFFFLPFLVGLPYSFFLRVISLSLSLRDSNTHSSIQT